MDVCCVHWWVVWVQCWEMDVTTTLNMPPAPHPETADTSSEVRFAPPRVVLAKVRMCN